MTSNLIFSFLKFVGVPKMTSRCIAPQGVRRLPWDNSVEGSLCWQEIIHRDLDLPQFVCVNEVQAAASVHEHFFRGETPYLRLENQDMVSWAWDLRWVI
jgi:hypothetical protein